MVQKLVPTPASVGADHHRRSFPRTPRGGGSPSCVISIPESCSFAVLVFGGGQGGGWNTHHSPPIFCFTMMTKRVEIDGMAIDLFSADGGRTWGSDMGDVKAFAQRTESALTSLAACINVIAGNVMRSERAAQREAASRNRDDRHKRRGKLYDAEPLAE